MPERLRVVHCGTSTVGAYALAGIIKHPDLELVGVLAKTNEKIGKDAGELCGLPTTGVIATRRIEDVLMLKPDCLSYFANPWGRYDDAIAQLVRFLEQGTNVVTSSFFSLINPEASTEVGLLEALTAACRRGQSSLFNSGIEPGAATIHLPATLLSLCESVETVKITEFYDYSHYPIARLIRDIWGFGMPPDYLAPVFTPGAEGSYEHLWGPSIKLLAKLLGKEVEALRLVKELWIADRPIQMAATRVETGTVGAMRFEVQGIVDGRPLIIVEHVNVGHPEAAPHWERPGESGIYQVTVKGRPDAVMQLTLGGRQHPSVAGRIATAMHCINAIPAVCAARTGLLSIADLPMYTTRRIDAA